MNNEAGAGEDEDFVAAVRARRGEKLPSLAERITLWLIGLGGTGWLIWSAFQW